ncbi:hypothetical protein [Cellulomonas flavigena]|uniref:hypothetical protein n=1 Tax=Cellulomonas flavigena TaxID=1711 RepID=UPI0011D28C7F|nr:hypothetical protein [Cellulomonas flavigena]
MAGRTVVGALVAVVVLAACSGPSEPAPAPTSELDGLLDVILGLDADPSVQPPEIRQAEEAVAACMHDAGFEYHPDESVGTGWRRTSPEVGTVAYAERYGYGETIETEEGRPPGLWVEPLESEGLRRNREYVASLSPAAVEQYERALDGEPWDGAGEYVPDGCRGLAYEEVAPDGYAGPADLRDVKLAVRGVYEAVESDPRVTDVRARWALCMEEAGYPGFSRPLDALSHVATDLWADWQDRYVDATGSPLGVSDYDVVRTTIPDALVELQDAETALAVADATCREEVRLREVEQEVEAQLEDEIVETYRADLDRWLAWAQDRERETGE